MEINSISIESLKQVFKRLNAFAYVKAIYQCDASSFSIAPELEPDILLIECVQRALQKEPQVAITYNLLPQLKKGAILIPENISLHVALVDNKKKTEYQTTVKNIKSVDFYLNSEAIFSLNKTEVLQNSLSFKKEGFPFTEKEIHFSKEQLNNYDQIIISTEITIFQNISLKINESGLTVPFIMADLNHEQKIIGAKTQYIVGTQPGLFTQLVRS